MLISQLSGNLHGLERYDLPGRGFQAGCWETNRKSTDVGAGVTTNNFKRYATFWAILLGWDAVSRAIASLEPTRRSGRQAENILREAEFLPHGPGKPEEPAAEQPRSSR